MTDRPYVRHHTDREARYVHGPRLPAREQLAIFDGYTCSGCRDGEKPCREGAPNRCGWPRARND